MGYLINVFTLKIKATMDKTIERDFFKAFEVGGVVHLCFIWMKHKYDLGFYISKDNEEKPKEVLPDEWQHHYDITLPQEIKKRTEDFNDSVICYTDSPLMDEIANNIDSLIGKERDRYIFSLLKPFKEFSDNINPKAIIQQLRGEVDGILGIKDYEKDLAMWESMPQNEQLKDINGEPAGTPKEQADACREAIENLKYRIKRTYYVADRYREILNEISYKKECGTVEKCLDRFWHIITLFANRLDALLLERGINLLWYQQESGIYLKWHRQIQDVEFYIGSHELARKYIDEALPKLDSQQQTESSQQAQALSSTQADKTEFHNKVPKCKGRPKGTLKDKMICENAANMLPKLHQLMNGRKGKEAALIITACIKAGIMTKPTFRQVSDEFGYIGNRSGYNKNMGERPFTDMEIEAIIKKLKE